MCVFCVPTCSFSFFFVFAFLSLPNIIATHLAVYSCAFFFFFGASFLTFAFVKASTIARLSPQNQTTTDLWPSYFYSQLVLPLFSFFFSEKKKKSNANLNFSIECHFSLSRHILLSPSLFFFF